MKLVADSTAQDLLSQGLDLCARARALDKMEQETLDRQIREGTTRSPTVSLWAAEAYDRELAAWERRVRSYLSRFPRYTGGLVANPDGKPPEDDAKNG